MRKLWNWAVRRALPILAVIAVSAFAISMVAIVVTVANQQRQVEEREAFDRQGCDRGNQLRQDIKDMGNADRQLLRDVLNGTLANAPAERVTALLLRLEPSFDKQEAAVEAIQLTNCAAALQKAKETR